MSAIQVSRGMRDIVPPISGLWEEILARHGALAQRYGYAYIETPLLEATELFSRGVGSGTDVVEKEMYTFIDKGSRSLTLRPEATASVVRAALSSHLDQRARPLRLRYSGPMFRYDRPQAGRYRQFSQVGVECLGELSPYLDVEVISLAMRFYEECGLAETSLQINSIGSREERIAYRIQLIAYYEPEASHLCADCQRRLHSNPLRLLDCKVDSDLAAAAPRLLDLLGPQSRQHFETVQMCLDHEGIPYVTNPSLVRGLDYYCHTVFEIWHGSLDGAQNALGGGGRYDGLAEVLGFPSCPGVGYSLGVDRLAALLESTLSGDSNSPYAWTDAIVLSIGDTMAFETWKVASRLAESIRSAGLRCSVDLSSRKVDAKLKAAAALGAQAALLLGEDELEKSMVTVRALESRSQSQVPWNSAVGAVRAVLDAQGMALSATPQARLDVELHKTKEIKGG